MPNEKPKLASAIFCNIANKGEDGKIDCKGIFTSFLAWSYPTSARIWHAVFTAYNLPESKSTITISIGFGKGKKTPLASAYVQKDKRGMGKALSVELNYQFQKEGLHTIFFNLVGTKTVLKVPVNVMTQSWPKFNKAEMNFLKMNTNVPASVRTNLQCTDCSKPFVFEERVNPDKAWADGVLPFPDKGYHECDSCGRRLYLKDIQGQIRTSIKNAIITARKEG